MSARSIIEALLQVNPDAIPRIRELLDADRNPHIVGTGIGADGLLCKRCGGAGIITFRDVPVRFVCWSCMPDVLQ